MAEDGFAGIPRDGMWATNMASASTACAQLGATKHAAVLYEHLLPYAAVNVMSGAGAAFGGSAALPLGVLASTMRRWDDAAGHFEAALERHSTMGAKPLTAMTLYWYATTLVARGRPDDRGRALDLVDQSLRIARDVGMEGLIPRMETLTRTLALAELDSAITADPSAVEDDLRTKAAPDGTVTILFSDIEDSTVLFEALGDQRAHELVRAHNALVREQIRRQRGYEVKTQGDGFMVAFGNAPDAVECAMAIQKDLARRNEEGSYPIRIRIGLHTGEAIKEGGDFFGKDVVLAARIAAKARGGEILISSSTREMVGRREGIRLEEGREEQLKGLRGKHRIHRVEWLSASAMPLE
jgi:eukaryotic-like serine/threonine-protein kinase